MPARLDDDDDDDIVVKQKWCREVKREIWKDEYKFSFSFIIQTCLTEGIS